jgi:hypothetical protein
MLSGRGLSILFWVAAFLLVPCWPWRAAGANDTRTSRHQHSNMQTFPLSGNFSCNESSGGTELSRFDRCSVLDGDALPLFYDPASGTDHLFSFRNIRIATEDAESFGGSGVTRFAPRYAYGTTSARWRGSVRAPVHNHQLTTGQLCRDSTQPGTFTYRREEGGIFSVRLTVAIKLATAVVLHDLQLEVVPCLSLDPACRPEPLRTAVHAFGLYILLHEWKLVVIKHQVGCLSVLNRGMARFVEVSFPAPNGSSLQIVSTQFHAEDQVMGRQKPSSRTCSITSCRAIIAVAICVAIATAATCMVALLVVRMCARSRHARAQASLCYQTHKQVSACNPASLAPQHITCRHASGSTWSQMPLHSTTMLQRSALYDVLRCGCI